MAIWKSAYGKGLILLAALVASIAASLQFGSMFIPLATVWREFGQWWAGNTEPTMLATILWQIRLPRILFGVIAGVGFSLVGLLMQTVTRNYLADPYILGVSSGASAGAVFAIIVGGFAFLGAYNVPLFAFFGGALAIALVIFLMRDSSSPVKLVLIGMGMSAFFSAVTMIIIYSAKHEAQVRSAMFWLLGSFSGLQWRDLPFCAAVIFAAAFVIWLYRSDLDIALLGEAEAKQLGLEIKRFQLQVVLLSSFLVAVLVANVGTIGFVGLIVPHLARMTAGPKHVHAIVFTCLIGAIIMVWADVLSRSLYAPQEIPIGVLTSLLGAPLFVAIVVGYYTDKG